MFYNAFSKGSLNVCKVDLVLTDFTTKVMQQIIDHDILEGTPFSLHTSTES